MYFQRHIIKIKIYNLAIVAGLLLILILESCAESEKIDPVSILKQLPVDNRLILVPESFINPFTSEYNLISFNMIKENNDENAFYQNIRETGVQYVLIPSNMVEDDNKRFPWMSNKNFRVCPGNIDHDNEKYYILLFWDNTNNSYHFFKFIYGEE